MKWIVNKFIGGVFERIANGDFGKPLQDFYWWMAGKKRVTGFVSYLLAYALAAATGVYCIDSEVVHYVAMCATVGKVSTGFNWLVGVFTAVGFMDKGWRDPKQPVPDVLKGIALQAGLTGTVLYAASYVLTFVYQYPWAAHAHTALTGVLLPTLVLGGLAAIPAGADETVIKPRT